MRCGWWVVLLVAACADADGDGRRGGRDCDDAEPRAFVGAQEVCDGVDNDCDGLVDEDVAFVAWQDRDGDGFGDPDRARRVCQLPDDGVENGDDCDDLEPRARPGADEVCDGVDNDCDGEVDEGVGETFFADADGDGHGVPDDTTTACLVPAGYSRLDDDCDDTEPLAWTGAVELCDGVDNDCDDEVDEGASDRVLWADVDGDGYGDPETLIIGCGVDDGAVANDDDCDDGDATVNPAAMEVPDNGLDDDCDPYVDEIAVPDHVADLAAARAVAGPDDVIQLAAGLYAGIVDLTGETFTLAGEGCDATVLYGEGVSTTLTMDGGAVEHLSISGGNPGGLYVAPGGSVVGRHLCVRDNVAEYDPTLDRGASGGGIEVRGELLLEDTLVTSNRAQNDAGGINVFVPGTLTGRRLQVVGNRAGIHGGGMAVKSATVVLSASVVAGNVAPRNGGGIYQRFIRDVDDAPEPETRLTNVTFAANRVTADTLPGSEGNANGSAVYASRGTVILTNVLMAEQADAEQPLFDESTSDLLVIFPGVSDAGDRERRQGHLVLAAFGRTDFVDFDPERDPSTWDLRLLPGSRFVDAGTPLIDDRDGSRSDLGAFGGPDAPDDWGDGLYLDADQDGMTDPWEVRYGLPPFRFDAGEDPDGDLLDNDAEFSAGTDPTVADSDGDGVPDGTEVVEGTDPLAAWDRTPWVVTPPDRRAVVLPGAEVVLDATGSGLPGVPVGAGTVSWRFLARPPASTAPLTVDGSVATFVPDAPGLYTVEVSVSAAARTSTGVVSVTAFTPDAVVPDDGDLATVLAAALDGDVVAVRAGDHVGTVVSDARDLTLLGVGDAADVVVTAPVDARVVDWTDHADLVLERLTLVGGTATGDGGGLRCRGCDLGDTGPQADPECEAAPPVPPSIQLRDVVLRDHVATTRGGALFADRCDVELTRVVLRDSAADEGGGLHLVSSDAVLHDLRIWDNTATTSGGGMYAEVTTEQVTMTASVIQGNDAPTGGALAWDGTGDEAYIGDFQHLVFADNTATDGVVSRLNGRARILDSLFVGNAGRWLVDTGGDGKQMLFVVLPGLDDNAASESLFRDGGLRPAQDVDDDPEVLSWSDDGVPDNDLWLPGADAPVLDAGRPNDAARDLDGTRSDIGPGGGPRGWPLAPLARLDRDRDGLPDAWEVHFGTDVERDDASEDPDGDGADNAEELARGTDPQTNDAG